MPCYEPWFDEISEDREAYLRARRPVEKCLESTRHTIGTYLMLHGIEPAHPVELENWTPTGTQRPFDYSQMGVGMVHRIAQHCVCDGVHFVQLMDAQTLMNRGDPYLPVVADVVFALRTKLAHRPLDRAAYATAFADFNGRPGEKLLGGNEGHLREPHPPADE